MGASAPNSSGEYREFLSVEEDDTVYDVGFNQAWNRLRLNVVRSDYEQQCAIDLWLTPDRAEQLAAALTLAAESLRHAQKEEG